MFCHDLAVSPNRVSVTSGKQPDIRDRVARYEADSAPVWLLQRVSTMFRLRCRPAHDLHRFRTGDIKLSVWLEHVIDGERKKLSAFDSIVTVVEPELSIFDLKLYVTLPSM